MSSSVSRSCLATFLLLATAAGGDAAPWSTLDKPEGGLPLAIEVVLTEPSSALRRSVPFDEAPQRFTNPVVASGDDPWVVRHGDYYYLCHSRRRSIWVNKCRRLQDLGVDNWQCVWTPPRGKPYSRELWAPELHYLQGKWWIYVAADDGENANHRMVVLEGTSDDPQARFSLKGKIAATPDRWAIDGTVLEMPDGRLYFIWSGWEGTENVAQHLYIASMSNPWTINGQRVRISSPELPWELRGKPLINEGPEVLWNQEKLFIIYSASGSWTDDYCLGQLTWTGGDPLAPQSWVKKPIALFARTADVFGPGHCSFVKSRDGSEDWIIYHSAKYSGAGWNRRVNMQPFTWHADASPNFGRPISAGVMLPEPAGDSLDTRISEAAELEGVE